MSSSTEEKQRRKSKGFFSKITKALTKSREVVTSSARISNEEIPKNLHLTPIGTGNSHIKHSTQSLIYPVTQVQPNSKGSTPTLNQKESSNGSLSKKEAYVPPVQIGFPTKSMSSENIQSRGSSTGSVKNVNYDPKLMEEFGKLTKLPIEIGFPSSGSNSNLKQTGSKSKEDDKKNSLSSLNAPAQNDKEDLVTDIPVETNAQDPATRKSPPNSSSSVSGRANMSTASRADGGTTSAKPLNESSWPSSAPTANNVGRKRFESLVDDGRNIRPNSSTSERSHNQVRNERSGSIASSIKSSRPSKAEAAEELLQKLRAGTTGKISGQQNSQQTMVEKSISLSSEVGYRKASVGTSAGSSFNPSVLKTLPESPYISPSKGQVRGPGIVSISPKNSDASLIDNSVVNGKFSISGSSDVPRLTISGTPIPRSPFGATTSSPTGTGHIRTASPFAPKSDARSGSIGSDSRPIRSMSRDNTGLGNSISKEPNMVGRPIFTRNIVSGSITTNATFCQPVSSKNTLETQVNAVVGRRRVEEGRSTGSLGYKPHPELTTIESAATSERNSASESVSEGVSQDINPYAIPGDIHVVQCFPNGEGLFKLVPNWDLESKSYGLTVAFADPRYNVWRRALFETIPSQQDFPLVIPVDLYTVIYDE